MTPVFIDSKDDPRIAPYTSVRERDLVGREGLFIAEGEVVLYHLVHAKELQTISVFLCEKRWEGLSPLLAHLPDAVPVFVANQKVMDQIVGFPIHRGILALGKRKCEPTAEALLSSLSGPCVVLGLVGIANHDNMGGIFRNAAAFGVQGVLLDASSCDPLYRKAIRVSVGAALRVPFARLHEGEDMVALLQKHKFTPIALSPSGTTTLHTLARRQRAGVLLGSEGDGLPAEVLSRCQSVSIPMAHGFDSLNVATTSGIVLHHLAKQS